MQIFYKWDANAGVMAPWPRFLKQMRGLFNHGESYRLEEVKKRSKRSHDHYFVRVDEMWQNLPEHITPRFPTSKHLRKFALIRTGWCKVQEHVYSTPTDAMTAGTMAKSANEYSVILVSDCVVTVHVAKSQSTQSHGMNATDFQKSKNDVLDYLSTLISVARNELVRSPSIVPSTNVNDEEARAAVRRRRVEA